MILYHGSTTYHILCCIVHKLVYHHDEQAVLLIVEYLYPRPERDKFVEKLLKTGWFEKIYIVPEKELSKARTKKLNQYSSYDVVMQQAAQISQAFEKWFPEDISKFSEINMLGEQWSFGIYVLYHQKKHNYFEDGSGLLGDYRRYFQVVRDINLTNYILLRYLGGGGRNQFVQKKYCDLKHQPPGFEDEKAVDLNIFAHIQSKEFHYEDELIRLFYGEIIKIPKESTVAVFMTQFVRTLTIQSFEVQRQFTLLIVDYFCHQDMLIIKPHPKDKWIDYHKYFPEATIIDQRIPSEFLPILLEKKVDITITASSTSIGGMSYITKELLSFGQDIESDFKRLHRDYAIYRIIERLNEDYTLVLSDSRRCFVKQFLSAYHFHQTNEPKKGKLIISSESDMVRSDKDAIVFLDNETHGQFLFDTERSRENYLVIRVSVYDRECELNDSEEWIWFYCEDENTRKEVLEMNEEYSLKHSRLQVEIHISEANQVLIEKGKNKALQFVLESKSNEDRDQILSEMNALVGLYQKESAMFNRVLADEGCKDYR